MKLTNLEPAWDSEVESWLIEKLEMTPYQKSKLIDSELVRKAPFKFYKRPKKDKISVWWRLTLPLFPVYIVLLFLTLPIKFMFTGKWTYGQKFYDNFHAKWIRKLGSDR